MCNKQIDSSVELESHSISMSVSVFLDCFCLFFWSLFLCLVFFFHFNHIFVFFSMGEWKRNNLSNAEQFAVTLQVSSYNISLIELAGIFE